MWASEPWVFASVQRRQRLPEVALQHLVSAERKKWHRRVGFNHEDADLRPAALLQGQPKPISERPSIRPSKDGRSLVDTQVLQRMHIDVGLVCRIQVVGRPDMHPVELKLNDGNAVGQSRQQERNGTRVSDADNWHSAGAGANNVTKVVRIKRTSSDPDALQFLCQVVAREPAIVLVLGAPNSVESIRRRQVSFALRTRV